jgi:putative endonuclease
MSKKAGYLAEAYARDYLVSQGLQWHESNYHCRLGEIDLIMRDGDYLVFVEVRSRTSSAFGGAIESITYNKKQKLIKTASLYLLARKFQNKQAIRFDVLSIEGRAPKISWIKNAFGADY